MENCTYNKTPPLLFTQSRLSAVRLFTSCSAPMSICVCDSHSQKAVHFISCVRYLKRHVVVNNHTALTDNEQPAGGAHSWVNNNTKRGKIANYVCTQSALARLHFISYCSQSVILPAETQLALRRSDKSALERAARI